MRKGIVKSENKGVCSFLEARPAQKAFLRNSTTRDRQGQVFAAHVFFADGCSLPPPALTLWVKNFLCGKDFKALNRVPRAGVESSAMEGLKNLEDAALGTRGRAGEWMNSMVSEEFPYLNLPVILWHNHNFSRVTKHLPKPAQGISELTGLFC